MATTTRARRRPLRADRGCKASRPRNLRRHGATVPPMDEVSIDIAAPRDKVWGLISDFGNMGTWSPELRRIIWLRGAKEPAVGARFLGINRHGVMAWA